MFDVLVVLPEWIEHSTSPLPRGVFALIQLFFSSETEEELRDETGHGAIYWRPLWAALGAAHLRSLWTDLEGFR
jgi:hypothetical protein